MEDAFQPFSYSLSKLFAQHWPLFTDRYQRDYAWEREEVDQFIDDINRLRTARAEDSDHRQFFGAILAIAHERTEYQRKEHEIVDGQQRLTTFSLAMAALVRGLEELQPVLIDEDEGKAKNLVAHVRKTVFADREWNQVESRDDDVRLFRMNDRDDEVFWALCRGDVTAAQKASSRDPHRLLVGAYQRIWGQLVTPAVALPASDALVELNDIHRTLSLGTQLIFIVAGTREQATQLFAVLNARGRRLEQADLLRSYTVMLATNGGRSAMDKVAGNWDAIDSAPRQVVDGFLRHFHASVTGDRVASAEVGAGYQRRFFDDRSLPLAKMEVGDVVSFMADLESAASLYRPLAAGEWPFSPPASGSAWVRDRLYRIVRVLGSDRSLPLLLAAARQGEKSLVSLLPHLERLETRAIVEKIEQNKISRLYMDVAAMLTARVMTIPAAVAEVEHWMVKWCDGNRFRANFLGLRYGSQRTNNLIKHLLTTIDDHWAWLKAGGTGLAQADGMDVWDFGNAWIEHIFPQNPKGGLPTGLTDSVHRIGNLAFLGPGAQRDLGNDLPSHANKLERYATAEPNLTKEVAEALKSSDWDASAIEARGHILADYASRVWGFSASSIGSATASLSLNRSQRFTFQSAAAHRSWFVSSALAVDDDHGRRLSVDAKGTGRRLVAGDWLVFIDTMEESGKPYIGMVGQVQSITALPDEGSRLAVIPASHVNVPDNPAGPVVSACLAGLPPLDGAELVPAGEEVLSELLAGN